MSSYQIEWPQLVDGSLTEAIAEVAGLAGTLRVEEVRSIVGGILRATGGWPFAAALPSKRQARMHAQRLLAEAFSHTLGGTASPAPGYQFHQKRSRLVIEAVTRLEINFADGEALGALPDMTPRRVQATIAERDENGPFRDASDLARRVSLVGQARASRLRKFLNFRREPTPHVRASGDWRRDLEALIAQEPAQDSRSRLLAALQRVAHVVASHRHPHLKHHLPRPFTQVERPRARMASESMVLPGRQYYYYTRDEIRAAQRSVDVLMFHIAWPKQNHPTRALLDALIAAHNRGVRIRVLVDRDRRGDPYRSQVINAAAVQYLLRHGVSVRTDRENRLLHSKMIVIDQEQTIIGSHNWSAGSFFGYDDLSMAVLSEDFARDSNRRFASRWRRAKPAKVGHGTA
ncbi:MAG: hypothetical protein KF745_08010 [Phycisphaeraceae bacterium]|nr:hypothetical protein [Phycisphaeraceae bacterium]